MAESPGRTRTAAGRFLALLEPLLHIHDTPRRTAAAFALGVAIGFSPFIGLHTLLALVLAFVFNLNRIAVLAGTWVNLPWFMGPYYAGATALGGWITGTPMPPGFVSKLDGIWEIAGWTNRFHALVDLLRPLLAPFLVGSLGGAVLAGFIAYRSTFAFISHHRRHHPKKVAGAEAEP